MIDLRSALTEVINEAARGRSHLIGPAPFGYSRTIPEAVDEYLATDAMRPIAEAVALAEAIGRLDAGWSLCRPSDGGTGWFVRVPWERRAVHGPIFGTPLEAVDAAHAALRALEQGQEQPYSDAGVGGLLR